MLRLEPEQFGVFLQQVAPVTLHVRQFEVLPDQLMPSSGDPGDQLVVGPGEADESAQLPLARPCRDGNVVDPRLQCRVKEFRPLVSDMVDQRLAEEEMLETKAGRYATVVEEVLEAAMVLQGNFLGRRCP